MMQGFFESLHSTVNLIRVSLWHFSYGCGSHLVYCYIVSVLNHCTPCVLTGQYDGILLADRGYPCPPYVMTPYPDPEPGPQSRYNLALCRTRARVEMTIGILKARFQCLRGLRVTPERACDIIVACVVLHNIATIRREQHPAIPQINDEEEPHVDLPEHRNGRIVRNAICNHYFAD